MSKRRARPWLQDVGRRTLKDVRRTWSPQEIYKLITSKQWAYKQNWPFYHCRDKAFLSLLYLTAGRVGEILSLIRSQFDLEADQDFIIIRNMLTEKVSSKSMNLPFREEFPLAREGILSQFTQLIMEYILPMELDEILFPFSRQRAHQITGFITAKWPHWFRSQGERLYARLLGSDIIALKDLVNVVNVSTLAQYVKKPWDESREKLKP